MNPHPRIALPKPDDWEPSHAAAFVQDWVGYWKVWRPGLAPYAWGKTRDEALANLLKLEYRGRPMKHVTVECTLHIPIPYSTAAEVEEACGVAMTPREYVESELRYISAIHEHGVAVELVPAGTESVPESWEE